MSRLLSAYSQCTHRIEGRCITHLAEEVNESSLTRWGSIYITLERGASLTKSGAKALVSQYTEAVTLYKCYWDDKLDGYRADARYR